MKTSVLLIASLFLFAWACDAGGASETSKNVALDASYNNVMTKEEVMADDESDQSSTDAQVERKLIKNGNIDFETKSVTETQNQLIELVKHYKGYLSNQTQSEYGDRISNRMQVRVPADQFDAFFKEVTAIAHRVERQDISVDDVTQEFIDVEARIKTKKELETRYFNLLNQAKSVEEMLSIERELGNLRSDIESMEGRLKYLKSQTSYSTIHIEFYQLTSRDFGFFSKFVQAFANGWQALLSFIIGVVTLWPFWIIIGLLIYLVRRFNLFSRKKRID